MLMAVTRRSESCTRNVRSGFGQIHELVSEHRLPGPIDPVEGNERTMPRPDCAELSQQVS
jgi:hypothetical protein